MSHKLSENLVDELETAKMKGLIEVAYTTTENKSTNVTVYFAEDVKNEARINFARYLNRKYLIFNSKFHFDNDTYTFSFCPLFMTINQYFQIPHE